MSNAVSRGPGRGKPGQDHNVAPMADQQQQFVMPFVNAPQTNYRMQHPPMQQTYNAYGNSAPYTPQNPYYQQQQQPSQQQAPPQHQQQQPYYRPDYNNMYSHQYNQYQNMQPQYHQDAVNYQPVASQPPPQNPPVVAEQKRKKVILEIVDPTTNQKIDVMSPQTSTSTVVPPPPVAPEVAEKKEQLNRDFLEKVKKGLEQESQGKSSNPPTATAPVMSLPNFSVPPPAFAQNASFAPSTVAPQKTSVPEQDHTQQSNVAPDVPEPVAVSAQPETFESKHEVPVPVSPPETSVKRSPTVESPASGAAESAVSGGVSSAHVTPTLRKEESKEEFDDDKFDENESRCDGSSPPLEVDAESVAEKSPEDLAKEKAEKEAEEKEKLRLRGEELDQRIAQLLSSGNGDIPKGTYGREFMVAVREYEKVFQHTPCPLSPQQLSEFGLDIKMMRIADKKPNFTPTWVPGNKGNRQSNIYRGRTTTDGTGRGAQPRDRQNHKRPPVVRASIERVQRVTLASSKDAWKPERQRAGEALPEEEAAIKDICKKVRALMNKITPNSQIPLTREFISYNVSSNDDQLTQVVEIVFDKAVEEPKFCALYAEMCKTQAEHEMKLSDRKSAFRNKILTRTQNHFQNKKEFDEERMAVIEKEEDAAKRELLKMEERTKYRRRKFGVMTFIGHLYRNQLLSTKILSACTAELLPSILPKKVGDKEMPPTKEDFDEESVHCAMQLLETVGAMVEKQLPGFMDHWLQKLDAAKPICSNKIKFMIMNLTELKNNKFVPRKSVETGPKKIDEIHNEIRQEKIENEKARDQYDRDRDRRHGGGVRPNSNSLRKQGPVSRNSLERNKGFQHPEQKRAAAAATTKLTSSNVQPKNISLSGLNDSALGKNKKEWHSGASGGGTTSDPPKSAWGRRDSNDQRKKSTVDDRQSALAAAKEIGSINMSTRRSASQNSIPDKVEEELDDEQKALREKIMNTVTSDLREVVSGDLPIKEMVSSLNDFVGKEKYASPSLSAVYEMSIRAASEKAYKETERTTLAHVLRLSLTGKDQKQAFIEGATRFCKYAVETEMWQDYPQTWTQTADVLMKTMHVHHEVIGEEKVEHLALVDMGPAFLAAKTSDKKKFTLFVQVLKKLVEAEMAESGSNKADGVSWDFHEVPFKKEMEKDGLMEELESTIMESTKTTTDEKPTLASLLRQS